MGFLFFMRETYYDKALLEIKNFIFKLKFIRLHNYKVVHNLIYLI
jgi:hypothetical protein